MEVTFAPKSLVPETEIVPVLESAASRSKFPVIVMLPKRLVAPTVSAVLSPKRRVPVPRFAVSARTVELALLTVPLNQSEEFVVVNVVSAPRVVAFT